MFIVLVKGYFLDIFSTAQLGTIKVLQLLEGRKSNGVDELLQLCGKNE